MSTYGRESYAHTNAGKQEENSVQIKRVICWYYIGLVASVGSGNMFDA